MTDSEKWAIWTLGVIALTVTAWIALVAWRGNGPWTIAVFSFLSLTAIPRNSRRYFIKGARFDEREGEIADKALLAGLRSVWLALVIVPMAMGLFKGWTSTLSLPVWELLAGLLWASLLLLMVQSVTTLVLYRKG